MAISTVQFKDALKVLDSLNRLSEKYGGDAKIIQDNAPLVKALESGNKKEALEIIEHMREETKAAMKRNMSKVSDGLSKIDKADSELKKMLVNLKRPNERTEA